MSKIIFKVPGKDQPGFLLRTKKALEFKRNLDLGISPEIIDDMVEFLLPYITEPVDRDEARDALLNASEEQFNQLINQFTAYSENPTLPESSVKS